MATILMILLREVILKIHNLTFNDAQIEFNDTQFVQYYTLK